MLLVVDGQMEMKHKEMLRMLVGIPDPNPAQWESLFAESIHFESTRQAFSQMIQQVPRHVKDGMKAVNGGIPTKDFETFVVKSTICILGTANTQGFDVTQSMPRGPSLFHNLTCTIGEIFREGAMRLQRTKNAPVDGSKVRSDVCRILLTPEEATVSSRPDSAEKEEDPPESFMDVMNVITDAAGVQKLGLTWMRTTAKARGINLLDGDEQPLKDKTEVLRRIITQLAMELEQVRC